MLEKYKSDDKLLLSLAKVAIGDAFSEIKQPKEAIEYYQKGMEINTNELTTPIILMKCAKLHELEGSYKSAQMCYKTIKSEYPESLIGKNIDKYINNIEDDK